MLGWGTLTGTPIQGSRGLPLGRCAPGIPVRVPVPGVSASLKGRRTIPSARVLFLEWRGEARSGLPDDRRGDIGTFQLRAYTAQSARIGSSAIIGSNPIEPPILATLIPLTKSLTC